MSNPKHLNDLIHAKVRLGIMSLLMTYEECDFTFLKKTLEITDGNLGSHLLKLEEANYIEIKKTFVRKRPRTIVTVTEIGMHAYRDYIKSLESILNINK
ncbi:transcriptional regulator [Bacillus safensis]|uniref:winged helix-turn-helix domain-containing protein n=1 Tax=Bacillus safensis TaxID=561879 RepID=UPI00203F10DE|nr:transcriptional regulator [Bacillus safensis]MCM2990169.1 transcriptional regulator [Bacillus safensis]